MHAIQSKHEEAQLDAVHLIIQIEKASTIRRWLESKRANGEPPEWIRNENPDVIDLEYTEDKQAQLKTIVVGYTSQGASGACRIQT